MIRVRHVGFTIDRKGLRRITRQSTNHTLIAIQHLSPVRYQEEARAGTVEISIKGLSGGLGKDGAAHCRATESPGVRRSDTRKHHDQKAW